MRSSFQTRSVRLKSVYVHQYLNRHKGNDKIWRVGEVNGNPGNYAIHGEIQYPIGSGPRHIRIRGNRLHKPFLLAHLLTTLQAICCTPSMNWRAP